MSTLKLDTIASRDGTESTDVTNVINGSAKAWVNFNGTGTVAINESFNVSSITDLGTGYYTVTFTNSLEDGYYAVALSQKYTNSGNTSSIAANRYHDTTDLGSRFSIALRHVNGSQYDSYMVTAAVFR
jgi:hypothetical protein